MIGGGAEGGHQVRGLEVGGTRKGEGVVMALLQLFLQQEAQPPVLQTEVGVVGTVGISLVVEVVVEVGGAVVVIRRGPPQDREVIALAVVPIAVDHLRVVVEDHQKVPEVNNHFVL